jgi:hypothetical protein
MKTCPHCNKPCEDGDIFCTNCGYMFSADNIPAQDKENGEPQMREYQPPEQNDRQNAQDQQQTPYGQQAPYGQQNPYGQQQYSQPQYQQPGYQQNNYQQPPYNCPPPGADGFRTPPESGKQSGLATASLVLGILALVFAMCYGIGIIMAIPGLILGILSLKKIRATGQQGHGMAVAGIVMSSIGLVVGVLTICAMIWFFQTPEGQQFMSQYKDMLNGMYNK